VQRGDGVGGEPADVDHGLSQAGRRADARDHEPLARDADDRLPVGAAGHEGVGGDPLLAAELGAPAVPLVDPLSGAVADGGHENPVQVPDSHRIFTSIPSEFPRIAVRGKGFGTLTSITAQVLSAIARLVLKDCHP
jgi:hypothetical protein